MNDTLNALHPVEKFNSIQFNLGFREMYDNPEKSELLTPFLSITS